jgi:hypothetical protein
VTTTTPDRIDFAAGAVIETVGGLGSPAANIRQRAANAALVRKVGRTPMTPLLFTDSGA